MEWRGAGDEGAAMAAKDSLWQIFIDASEALGNRAY